MQSQNIPKVTIHTISYNEEVLIDFFVKHYRKQFSNCVIKVWDNYSSDNTAKIAKELGCEVFYYDSEDSLDDSKYLEIKNHMWKKADTDWVIVCDVDELLEVSEDDINTFEKEEINIINFSGYTLVNRKNVIDLKSMNMGFRDKEYDKFYMFNKKYVKEINYGYGAHQAAPTFQTNIIIKHSKKTYNAYHYKYLSKQYSTARKDLYEKRMSRINKAVGVGYQYAMSQEELEKKAPQYHLDTIYNKLELIKVINR